ncbi:acyl-CoA dehydratase activase [Vagococcus acidifermentans]|uniref:ATPase BadF/BadG/BcrA/BcrD type domain-containing protein n=1 Tax=Vagococcus acidifermentans TaxID=564710 RepID=A0A430B2T7_9ENTE|nr:acyl-CoA dehydratase activase [Vagococcus acidifermentans]RSU14633.1 hypothetical protein CBF27_01215 [Vagococcus acidifermentans]
MKIIGLDSGSTTTKGVLLSDGQLLAQSLVLTAGNPRKAMEQVLTHLAQSGKTPVVTTGYGRKLIDSDKSVTEITCHAKGAAFLHPETVGIIDIGGQDSKTIQLDNMGFVTEFNMNDKCAAGTGRFVEVLMTILDEPIEQLDTFVKTAQPLKINSMCTVFAETEVISLIAKGEEREDIALGVLHSICQRIANQFTRVSSSVKGDVFFSGGLAKSDVMRQILSEYTGRHIVTHPLAQYTGAIGAAILGMKKHL